MLDVGDILPSVKINLKGTDVDIHEYFQEKTGVIFGVSGAFSPVCTEKHLPGFRDAAEEFKRKINFLGCLAVNDPYVLKAWARHARVSDQLTFVADVDGTLTRKLRLEHDYTDENLGIRCRRFAMVISPGSRVWWIGFDENAFADVVMKQVDRMTAALSTKVPAWDYKKQGMDWQAVPELCPQNCKRQSPIDVDRDVVLDGGEGDDIEVCYPMSATEYTFHHNGYPMKVTTTEKSASMGHVLVDGKKYEVAEFHFHAPAEHTVDKARHALEMHIVHKHADDDLVVVGFLFEKGSESACNSVLRSILDARPLDASALPQKHEQHIPLSELIDALVIEGESTFFRYCGSLTTPPCSEIVNWFLASKTIPVLASELEEFQKMLQCSDNSLGNYRCLQNTKDNLNNMEKIFSVKCIKTEN